ncbi:MAG TPA: signal peptidase I [Methylomirabilota bacterium]|nr:signal peptidase I [Methylomirabilota bacterium]
MIHWLFSKAVREAVAMRKHVQRSLNAQRDLLKPEAIGAVLAKIAELNEAISQKANTGKIRIKAEELEFAANKWLKPYPNPLWRENVEVLLVALAVAMGIRTFFLQPFKIPTGSMQPTLYGVTSKNLLDDKNFQIPTGIERIKEWFEGISYVHVVAQSDGELQKVEPPVKLLIFNIKQTIVIGGVAQTIWFPPDYGEAPLQMRAGLEAGHIYHKGDEVVKMEVSAGDHLFVDRLTYNFRKPERGDIVVFETKGIPADRRENPPYWNIPPDEFYIKRLVGLGGEKIQVGDDRHLVIDGKRLDSSTPHFENLYSFDPKSPPQESHYSGHMNQPQMPFFPDGSATYQIPAGHVMVMGDNTMNSLDSRYWGDFPESAIIGKSFFVYWPLTSRFGLSNP